MDALQEALIKLHQEHIPAPTPEGWIDCACGWEANHPLLPNPMEQAALDTPELPDPPYRTGEPDPEHLHNEGPWLEHLAGLQRDLLASVAPAPSE